MDLDSSLQPRGYRLLQQDPAAARGHRRARRRAVRHAAEDHAGEHRRSRRGRRRRRSPRPRDQGRAVARRRDLDPRPLRLTRRSRSSAPAIAAAVAFAAWQHSAKGRSTTSRVETAHAGRRRPRRSPAVSRPARRDAGRGLVLHPDIGGLRPLFEDMARRLATHGFAVLRGRAVRRVSRSDAGVDVEARMAAVKDLDDDAAARRSQPRPPICSSSKTTWHGCRCSASAWAATTCSRPRRPTASTPRLRSTA